MGNDIPLRKLRATVKRARSVSVAVFVAEHKPITVPVTKQAVIDAIARLRARKVTSVRCQDLFGELVIG